jgi:hypothetical protein
MTRKELILRMVEKLPDDVAYDRVIYHLDVMRAVEEGTAQIERGEGIDHEELFTQLLAEDEKSPDHLGTRSKTRPGKHSPAHHEKRSAGRGVIRKPAEKSRREAEGLS